MKKRSKQDAGRKKQGKYSTSKPYWEMTAAEL